MLRVILGSLLALAAAPALAQTVFGGEEAPPRPAPRVPAREATVANDTDRVLRELFVHPSDSAERGPDRLGNGVLPPKAILRVPLDRRAAPRAACTWQAVAVFDDGEEERRSFDACRSARAIFADAGPARELEVQNDTDLVLSELYLAPPGARERGRDRLGSETVAAGEAFRLKLRGTGPAACVFDIRAVFADSTEETRERVDVCRTTRVGFGDQSAPVRQVPVINRGRNPIRELYARPAGTAPGTAAAGWGADRLGSAQVAPRGDFRLRVRSRACLFDLRAVAGTNREEVKDGVDLCAVQGVVFGERPDEAPRRVVLANNHGRTVRQAFLVPTKTGEWGEDTLGAAVIAPGGRYEASFEGGCHADLRVVFDTEAAEERRAIDICAEAVIALRPGWTLDKSVGPPPAPAPRAEEQAAPAKPEPAAAPSEPKASTAEAASAPSEPKAATANAAAAPSEPMAPAGAAEPPERRTAAATPPGAVRLRNAAAVPLVAFHADPIGAPRGPDRLNRAALGAGDTMEFAPPDDLPSGPARCLADLTAVFGDGREAHLPARDICAGGEVVLE